MSDIPIVVIANKQDLPSKLTYVNQNHFSSFTPTIDSMKSSDIVQKLGLNELRGKHKWYIQPACAVSGDGVLESMLEMSNMIKQHRKGTDY